MTKARTEQKPSVFIATPMYGGMCHGTYANSLVDAVYVFLSEGVPFTYCPRYNEALITKARNNLAARFMQTNFSHLMFIDADIGFDARDILSMANADKDIICGIYPHKSINWEQVEQAVHDGVPARELPLHTGTFPVNGLDGTDAFEKMKPSVHKPVEVDSCGAGFMLIKREVFESLADKVPSYSTGKVDDMVPGERKEYFGTGVEPDGNYLLSEDYFFCNLARENGFKVWVAPWVKLTHTGSYTFAGRPQESD